MDLCDTLKDRGGFIDIDFKGLLWVVLLLGIIIAGPVFIGGWELGKYLYRHIDIEWTNPE